MPSTTIQQLATTCGVSTATISRALAGKPHVRADVRERVQREAARLGYRRNDLVGSLMAHVRTSRTHHFVGNLAFVHIPAKRKPMMGPQLKRIVESAQARARELGFSAGVFQLESGAREEEALARVVRARGVSGVMFLYPEPSESPVHFPWGEFAATALDFARREPRLNTICQDHFVTLKGALSRLQAAGYRRIGLYIERFKDERTDGRWSAALFSCQNTMGGIGGIPPCSPEVMVEGVFMQWYRKHRPDIVVGHIVDAVKWLRRAGVRVPEDTGFFNLNWEARTFPCAGIDPQLDLQGRVAAEALISQVQHGERGLPTAPRMIMVRGRIVDGPTVLQGLNVE